MWDDDPDRQEAFEYVLGATAHTLAQMGDIQAALLLGDVERLDMESERRGRSERNVWAQDGSDWPVNSTVYYLEVEPYLRPRFTPEVRGRALPVMRDFAQRCQQAMPEFLEVRLALHSIDVESWRQTLHQRSARDDVTNSARRERLDPQSPVADGLTSRTPKSWPSTSRWFAFKLRLGTTVRSPSRHCRELVSELETSGCQTSCSSGTGMRC